MRSADRTLLLVSLCALFGTLWHRIEPVLAVTPVRHRIETGPTPTPTQTPRPTSITMAASAGSAACSAVAPGGYFSQSLACDATYTSADLTWPESASTLTGMNCSVSGDASCSYQYTFFTGSGVSTALNCSHTSPTTSCSDSGRSIAVTSSNLVAIRGIDSANNCSNSTRPTCVVFYTVP